MTETSTSIPAFSSLGLRDEILRAIDDAGYSSPTPIQAAAIPVVLAGRDVLGIAQTGTGKTASFTLPMIEKLASGRGRARMPRSLILSPTRELATQTAQNFELYGKYLKLSHVLLIGGVGMGDQEKQLEKGVDVLIATPGRMLDWFERGRILLGGVQIMVIDEADRMLDMGFMPDVERIISLLPARQQTLLFSATMAKEIRSLADRFMHDPAVIEVTRPASTVKNIDDVLVAVSSRNKVDALLELIESQDIDKAIIFSNRKRSVSELNRTLKRRKLNASDIHGDLDQSQRQATLDAFKSGTVDFLVATDVAARGLDISDMPVVINFDVPTHADDYVHRIGRTGRAGRKGRAFTFVTEDEQKYVAAIAALVGRKIPSLQLGRGARQVDEVVAGPVETPVPAPAPAKRGKGRTPLRSASDEPNRRRQSSAAPMPADAPQPDIIGTPIEHAPAAEQRAARPPQREQRPPRHEFSDEPVVGFGDAVPAFMRIVVPAHSKSADDA